MARRLRVQFAGAIYHVSARGVERRVIFDDDKDREHFLKRVEDGIEEYGVRLYLYCLMANHFHLLVETPAGNLSAFMQKIETAHTVYYNRRHNRTGHLMQGRYDARPVEGNAYLDRLSRYLHLNPVYVEKNVKKPLDERIRLLRDHKWSSYRSYAGLSEPVRFVDALPLLKMAGGRSDRERRRNYRRFVEAGLAKCDEEFLELMDASKWGIGDDEFQARIRDLHIDMALKTKRPEDVALRRVDLDVEPAVVTKVVAEVFGVEPESLKARHYGNRTRAVAARMLTRFSGMNQRDAGSYLNMGSGAAVCQQLSKLREANDEDLASKMKKIEDELRIKAVAQNKKLDS